MSLDGLRAWIGEVERKLGMRTRVFLVLAVIAIGGAGAAVYLAIDARDNSVSESDVQALQEKLEARIGRRAGAAAPPRPKRLSWKPRSEAPRPKRRRGAASGASGEAAAAAGAGLGATQPEGGAARRRRRSAEAAPTGGSASKARQGSLGRNWSNRRRKRTKGRREAKARNSSLCDTH